MLRHRSFLKKSIFPSLVVLLSAGLVLFNFNSNSNVLAQSSANGLNGAVGIIGDSNLDEYRANDNRGGEYSATTFNLIELLVNKRGMNVGPWGTWGEPRRSGYKYNWSRSGARMQDMINSGQHTGLAAQVASGEVKYVFISLGVNDFHVWNNTYTEIYNGTLSDVQVQQKVQKMIANMTLAVETIQRAGSVPIVITNQGDPGISKQFQGYFPNVSGRQRVSNAINQYNTGIKNLATAKNIGFFDQYAWGNALENKINAQGNIVVGGELINTLVAGNEPHHMQLGDSVGHVGTVVNGLMANEWFINPFNMYYQTKLVPFTEQEMLANAGIKTSATPTPTATPRPTPTPTPIPTATPTATPNPLYGNGDVNGDNLISPLDVVALITQWYLPSDGSPDQYRDGVVTALDFAVVYQKLNQLP